jgi:hypothetical protein
MPARLVDEIIGMLGSVDTEWRDDFGYGVVARCVYHERALTRDERRALVGRLVANLRAGIGRSGDDSVLLRSFSALDLSILAALDNDDPFLDEPAFRSLLDAVLAYLRDERDLRGFEPRVGWIHATAHAADTLKFLARSRHLTAADQARLLEAVAERMLGAGTPVFTHAEDERLARVLLSLARRNDFEVAALERWLPRFVALEKSVWAKAPPEPALLDAAQNARNLLRAFYLLLSLPAAEPSSGVLSAREKVGATLVQIQR